MKKNENDYFKERQKKSAFNFSILFYLLLSVTGILGSLYFKNRYELGINSLEFRPEEFNSIFTIIPYLIFFIFLKLFLDLLNGIGPFSGSSSFSEKSVLFKVHLFFFYIWCVLIFLFGFCIPIFSFSIYSTGIFLLNLVIILPLIIMVIVNG